MTDYPDPMLRYFACAHLPEGIMRDIASTFQGMARDLVVRLPRTPERTVALRKLLESKDAAVRAALDTGT